MAQQRGTHRAQPHSRKARPAFNFWPQGLWVCPRALAPHMCTAQNNSQTLLGKKCCGNPGDRPWAGRRVPVRPEACWTAHGKALCSRLWKVLDEQLTASASASQELSLCRYYTLEGGHNHR